MGEQKAFNLGMLAGFFFSVAAFAGNWLITPMRHPDATPLRTTAVVVQAVACLGIAVFLVLRSRSKASASPAA